MNADIKICIVGWYYFKEIYKQLSKSKFDIHVIAHRHNEILDNLNIKYSIKDNIGLEYGAYDWYIKNIWDGKSDVFFMHDDIEILKFDDCLSSIYNKMKNKNVGHGVSGKKKNTGERFFYMSSKLIKIIKTEYNGIWYDKENFGYNKMRVQPEHWNPRRYNDGGPMFSNMIKEINKKYNIKVFFRVYDNRLITYNKGKIPVIKNIGKKEKEKKRKEINIRKKKKRQQEKEWNDIYGK